MYTEKIDAKDTTYLESRLKPIGITQHFRRFACNHIGGVGDYWDVDKHGNILIRFPSAKGMGFQEYNKKVAARYEGAEVKDEVPTMIERTRFRAGHEPVARDGSLTRYLTPRGCPSPLFIPWRLLHRIRDGGKSEVLFVTEGEIKAAAADRHGLPIVAVPGIQNHGKELNFLHELRLVIEALGVERLVFVYDNDLFDLGNKTDPGGNPTKRPHSFYSSAKNFATRAQALEKQAFIAWPEVTPDGPKRGLDDEITARIGEAPRNLSEIEREDENCDDLYVTPLLWNLARHFKWGLGNIGDIFTTRELREELHWIWAGRKEMRQLEQLARGKEAAAHGWQTRRIDTLNDHDLKKLWSLHSPEAFVERHRTHMADWEHFQFGEKNRRYNIEGGRCVLDGLEVQLKLEQRDGTLYATNSDGVRRRLGHFTVRGKWRLYGAREAYVLEIAHASGRVEYKMVAPDILASSDRFRVLMLGLGTVWKGKQDELNEIVEECVVTAPAAEVSDGLGWDPERKRWVWANGLYQAGGLGYIPADDEGAVNIDGHTSILVSSPMFKAEKHLDEERLLAFSARGSHTTWQRWVDHAHVVYGDRAMVAGMAFVVATTVMDLVREKRRFFPIMFMFGPKGQGKTTFCRSVQSFYGKPLPPRNMETGTTVAGLQRSLMRYSQIPMFLDEASSRTRPELLDIMKNYFDGTAGTQGVKSASNETKSFQARAAVIAASQHLPAHDPALVSRCILVEFPQREAPTMEQKERMGALRAIEDAGLQHLVHQVLELRPKIESHWSMTFMRLYKRILDHCDAEKIPVDDRTAEIHAAMMTPLACIHKELQVSVDEEMIVKAFVDMLPLHAEASAATDEGEAWWTIFQAMRQKGALLDGTHYTIDRQEGQLSIQFRQCHVAYVRELHQMGQKGLPEATLRRYLIGNKAFVANRQARLRTDYSPTWLLVFELEKLHVNLD